MFWPFHKSRYSDGEIDLVEMYKIKGDELNDYIPSIYYEIYLKENNKKIGRCDLRIGMDHKLYYAGNIGYSIAKPHRGNHYAFKACKILFELARDKYKMDEIIITCNPDNIASNKTCERLDGEFVEVVEVPMNHWLRNQGDYAKCIYRFKL